MPYEVKLDVFEGPIDLLLHLITRKRVDIYEISLTEITDEFVGALGDMEHLDLEAATGFLVVASTLLELKSARLLPGPPISDEAQNRLLEERDLLLARLVECATFREAGGWLSSSLEAGALRHPRVVPLEEHLLAAVRDIRLTLDVAQVLAAAEVVFSVPPPRELDMSHVAPIRASVRDAIDEIAHLLEGRGRVTFEELCEGKREKLEIVVRFLGLLELFKAGAVDLGQADRFGDIVVSWTGEVSGGQVKDEVEEYTFVPEERA